MVGGRTDIGEADSNAQATHMDLFPTYRGVNVNPTGLKGSKTDLSAAERVMRVVYRIADMTSTTVCVIFRGSDIVTTSVSKADSPAKTLHTSVSIPHTGVDAAHTDVDAGRTRPGFMGMNVNAAYMHASTIQTGVDVSHRVLVMTQRPNSDTPRSVSNPVSRPQNDDAKL